MTSIHPSIQTSVTYNIKSAGYPAVELKEGTLKRHRTTLTEEDYINKLGKFDTFQIYYNYIT